MQNIHLHVDLTIGHASTQSRQWVDGSNGSQFWIGHIGHVLCPSPSHGQLAYIQHLVG